MSARGGLWLGWLVALLAMAGFSALGHWQLGRMHYKQALLDDVQRLLDARDPQPLATAADPARADAHAWSAGSGHFADAPALLLDNQMRDGQPGVRGYRLFVPDAGSPLLVELGWLPLGNQRQMPQLPRPQGRVEVAGLLAPPPAAGLLTAAPQPQADGSLLLIAIDVAELAPLLGQPRLAPRLLKLDPALPLGYTRDLDILPNTLPPEKHLGYALQWFALALAVLVTALLLTYRGRRRRASSIQP